MPHGFPFFCPPVASRRLQELLPKRDVKQYSTTTTSPRTFFISDQTFANIAV